MPTESVWLIPKGGPVSVSLLLTFAAKNTKGNNNTKAIVAEMPMIRRRIFPIPVKVIMIYLTIVAADAKYPASFNRHCSIFG